MNGATYSLGDFLKTEKKKKTAAEPEAFGADLNSLALADLDAWVPELFPSAHKSANGSYRVTSAELGRDLEEDPVDIAGGHRGFWRRRHGRPSRG
jgi:hypothetical protein